MLAGRLEGAYEFTASGLKPMLRHLLTTYAILLARRLGTMKK